jgi:phosphoglycolate phosphatase
MALPAPTLVIFDMDGTAVRHLNPAMLHVLEKFDDALYTCGRFFRWALRHKKGEPIIAPDDEFLTRKKPRLLVHRAIHKVRRKPVEQIVEPGPGLYNILNFLRDRGIPMALVSNGLGKGYGHDILQTFDLEDYFSTTIFREDIRKSKPHPEPLLTALKAMDFTPKDDDVIWYIGDRRKDILAAEALSHHVSGTVVPIAYALNAAIAVLERNFGPEHIIPSYPDMKIILEAAFKKSGREKLT